MKALRRIVGKGRAPIAERTNRWLGIDFSGDRTRWSPSTTRGNVWISDVRPGRRRLALHDLVVVQKLEGRLCPFQRLAALLRGRDYRAAAIDAPFSVPESFFRASGHSTLLNLVASLPRSEDFPSGVSFVTAVAGRPPPLAPPKPLRHTEYYWAKRGVAVRSTMWAGDSKGTGRPGAPMTSACITLLSLSRTPLWPWSGATSSAIAEAFPAAQLLTWGLPHQGYNGSSPKAAWIRKTIVQSLETRIDLGRHRYKAERNADALDAVLAAFAAIAVTSGSLAVQPAPCADPEGWIAVHSNSPRPMGEG